MCMKSLRELLMKQNNVTELGLGIIDSSQFHFFSFSSFNHLAHAELILLHTTINNIKYNNIK